MGDALDPLILAEAMEGVDSVFHVGPSFHPQEAEMGVRVVDAAINAGVEHFVYDSVLHPQITCFITASDEAYC